MATPPNVIVLGRCSSVPPTEWDTSKVGELILATHRKISLDTKSALYDFLGEYHPLDPNLHLIKRVGENFFSFTSGAEFFLKSVIDQTPHKAVKAAFLYDLIMGYFSVSQSIRYAELRGRSLTEHWEELHANSGESDSIHLANVRYWSNFAADEIEKKARHCAKRAKEECRKERLYECYFDEKGNLFRRLITTLNRRVDILLHKIDYFSIGKPVKNEVFITLDGKTVNLRHRAGRVALVDVWSTSCAPCRRKLPDLMELQKKHTSDLFEVIALNVDKGRDTLDAFLREPNFFNLDGHRTRDELADYLLPYLDAPKLDLPVVHLGLSRLLKDWDITAYPTLFLLDQDGVMHARGHDVPHDIIDDLLIRQSAGSI